MKEKGQEASHLLQPNEVGKKLVLHENSGMPAWPFDGQSSKIKANDLINMPGKRVSAMR